MELLLTARRILSAPDLDPRDPIVLTAVGTLTAAARSGLRCHGTATALWRFLCASPDSYDRINAADALGELPFDQEVFDAAVLVVKDPKAMTDLFAATLTLLSRETYAARVTPELLIAASEQMGRETWKFTYLVTTVHEHTPHGLDQSFLSSLRDRMAASEDPMVREASTDIAILLPWDGAYVEQLLLKDPVASVRAKIADCLAEIDGGGAGEAIGLACSALDFGGAGQGESVLSVVAQLHSTLATLCRSEVRSQKRRR